MKLFKFIPIFLFFTLYNSTTYAVDCSSIKMDSSVNIIKKIKCKATTKGEETQTSTTTKATKATKETTGKKNILGVEDGWKIWKKPGWMKKKN